MKKLMIFTSGLLLSTTLAVSAQSKKASTISVGVVGGFGHSWVRSIPNGGHRDFKPSPALGIGMTYSHDEHWACGSQLLISHEGYQNDVQMANGDIQNMGVNPVYPKLRNRKNKG